MTNICMIAKDRVRLTIQALDSLRKNTDPTGAYTLTLIDDGSEPGNDESVEELLEGWTNAVYVRISRSKGIVGLVRNLSIRIAEQYWGRGDFLYLSDNDVCFERRWLERMTRVLSCEPTLKVLGGFRHPFHQPNSCQSPQCKIDLADSPTVIEYTDAVAGYSHLMRWETWDTYGPFDSHAKGVGQSEDFAFCQKIVKDGGLVGYIDPPVLVVTGLTDTQGNKVVGYDDLKQMIPEGVYYE